MSALRATLGVCDEASRGNVLAFLILIEVIQTRRGQATLPDLETFVVERLQNDLGC
jgi:hypothetical protein